MKLHDAMVGKTIASVEYLEHELVGIKFDDGSGLRINQRSQTGYINITYIINTDTPVYTIKADNYEEAYEC